MAKRLMGIVVLGCPSVIQGTASKMFEQRVNQTLAVYEANKKHRPLVVCTGYHIPGTVESQAEALKKKLISMGVPGDDIVAESQSRSTLENAMKSKPILEKHGVQAVSVVTNKFHIPRSRFIFENMVPGYSYTFEEAMDGVSADQLSHLQKLENRKMVNLRPKMIASLD